MKKHHLTLRQAKNVKMVLLDHWEEVAAIRALFSIIRREALSDYLDSRQARFYLANSRRDASKVLSKMSDKDLNFLLAKRGQLPKIARRIRADLF